MEFVKYICEHAGRKIEITLPWKVVFDPYTDHVKDDTHQIDRESLILIFKATGITDFKNHPYTAFIERWSTGQQPWPIFVEDGYSIVRELYPENFGY